MSKRPDLISDISPDWTLNEDLWDNVRFIVGSVLDLQIYSVLNRSLEFNLNQALNYQLRKGVEDGM